MYSDGQYGIVKEKLVNIGFTITKNTSDYTLDGTTHSGDFVMMREKESSVEAYRMHGIKDVDRFFFSTTIMPSQVSGYAYARAVDVSFDYDEIGVAGVYDTYKHFWNGNIDTTTCQSYSHGRQCVKLFREEKKKMRNPSKGVGLQNALIYNNLYLEMEDKPVELAGPSPSPREYISGSLRRVIYFPLIGKISKTVSGSRRRN